MAYHKWNFSNLFDCEDLYFAENILGNVAQILQRALSPKRFGDLPRITHRAAQLRGEPGALIVKSGPRPVLPLLVRYVLFFLNASWRAQHKIDLLTHRNSDFQDLEVPSFCSNEKMIFLGVCQLLCGHEINVGAGRVHRRRSSLGCFRMLKRKMDLCQG